MGKFSAINAEEIPKSRTDFMLFFTGNICGATQCKVFVSLSFLNEAAGLERKHSAFMLFTRPPSFPLFSFFTPVVK